MFLTNKTFLGLNFSYLLLLLLSTTIIALLSLILAFEVVIFGRLKLFNIPVDLIDDDGLGLSFNILIELVRADDVKLFSTKSLSVEFL